MLRFAVIRPYDPRFRKRVFEFLGSLGFDHRDVPRFEVGAGDDDLEAWLRLLPFAPDLWLVPFHQHRAETGSIVDGFSALRAIHDRALLGEAPILMPVSDYAYASSFPRHMATFERAEPQLADRLVVMPSAEIGSDKVRVALKSLLT
jgi:hypothetical protein